MATITVAIASAQTKKIISKPKVTTVQRSAAPQTTQATLARGKAVYNITCIACHQKDGGGVPRLNPPLIKTTYVLGDKVSLIKIVLQGLQQPIEIDDEEYTNPMPAQPHLSDQQIADVLSYVRNNFGNKASFVTPAEVKSVRSKIK